jgi:hypothetical protein
VAVDNHFGWSRSELVNRKTCIKSDPEWPMMFLPQWHR